MKSLNTYLVISVLLLSLYINNKKSAKKNQQLGNVIYSILSPELFREQNSNSWILLDGGEDISKLNIEINESDICIKYGICTISDARGLFLRGFDNKLSKRVDKDRDVNTPAGTFQKDAFQGHSHQNSNLEFITSKDQNMSSTNRPYEGFSTYKDLFNEGIGKEFSDKYGRPSVASETRPKNLNFYIYMKINLD